MLEYSQYVKQLTVWDTRIIARLSSASVSAQLLSYSINNSKQKHVYGYRYADTGRQAMEALIGLQ